MTTALPLFPASVVGSMPRPLHVRELIEKDAWDEADERAMDAAIRYAVSMQEFAGLDVVTDGECGAARTSASSPSSLTGSRSK